MKMDGVATLMFALALPVAGGLTALAAVDLVALGDLAIIALAFGAAAQPHRWR